MPLPPEPSQGPLAQTLAWSFRPLAFMARNRERLGDAFSVRFVGFERPMVLVSDPAAIRALYTERRNGLPAGRKFALEPILGARSVLLLEGEEHLARRRLMLPPFHGERMRSYEAVVGEIVAAEIDSWPLGREFPIHARMQAVTLEVILRAVFGVSTGPRLDRLRLLLRDILAETGSVRAQLTTLFARRTGRDPLARVRARLAAVDAALFAEIAEHRRRPDLEERDDILSMLMTARFEDGPSAGRPSEIAGDDERERAKHEISAAMDDQELRDQLMTLLLAGHETTATALAWTFDLLLRHPVELGRLRGSLELGEEAYLKATIAESLRLRPVVPLAGRRLAAPLVTDDLELPAGTDVTAAIWLTHTNAALYPDPFAFRPERFLEAAPETYAWIPFGGGVRRCLGAAFAEFEMRIVLREVLLRCELRKADPRPERTGRRNITFSPRAGTPVVVDSRRPALEPALA
ncbi:MAG TPA: cytochrome P450 [Solirubrobacterales bacterium]|nr:cytochrome P450 [Solirubrobacterales bacterium]